VKTAKFSHEPKYYVYIYLDPRKPGRYTYGNFVTFFYEPFYVGKGTGDRWRYHLQKKSMERCTNKHKNNTIRAIMQHFDIRDYIIKTSSNLVEFTALYCYEPFLISLIGRTINGGPLTNSTDGGDTPPHGTENCKAGYINRSKKFTGRKVVHNSSGCFRVPPEEVPRYLEMGYQMGWPAHTKEKFYSHPKGQPPTPESNEKRKQTMKGMVSNTKGKVWVTNHSQHFLVSPEQAQHYLEMGWVRGRIPGCSKPKHQSHYQG